MSVKMRYKLVVEINNEIQVFEHWDYCQALTAAIKLNNLGYKAHVENIAD